MQWKRELRIGLVLLVVFLAAYHLPVLSRGFPAGITEALALLREYARRHVITCLLPAFFIAGAIAVLLKRESVMRYLGPRARKPVAYAVASVSGSVLAVCSCTVLPLFAGIYRMGAGLGPATAFLYAGPAINVLAVVLTARVLGPELGIARAVGAVGFSVLIGLAMSLTHDRGKPATSSGFRSPSDDDADPWKRAVIVALLVLFLLAANWAEPPQGILGTLLKDALPALLTVLVVAASALWLGVRWPVAVAYVVLVAVAGLILPLGRDAVYGTGTLLFALMLMVSGGQAAAWAEETWGFLKLILPLLLVGVVVAGALLGRPGHEGWVPSEWVSSAVGGNSLLANFFASLAGAFMYFATLTEIPIVQGLVGSGMGKGPALSLLLAGPALSLPNMLVIRSVMGTARTATFVVLVVLAATISGFVFGTLF